MRSPPPVPPLRGDLRPKKIGNRLAVDDPKRRVRVPIDELTLQIMECLADGPMSQDELAAELGAPRIELQRRVRVLTQQLLLQTPRAAAVLALSREEPGPIDAETVALTFDPKLRHACVACGACCHGSDIGPLSDAEVAVIEGHDWAPHIGRPVPAAALVQTVTGPSGAPIRLTGHRDGSCSMLTADKLCAIHKVLGPTKKPLVCQEFPFTFTRTPSGVDVSYSMECRAWWKAKQAAPVGVDDAPTVRALLARGAPLLRMPVPVPVTSGLDWAPDAWLALRAEVLAAIDAATDHPALVMAVLGPIRAAVTRSLEGYATSELFATRDAWAVPMVDAVDHSARFFEACARLDGLLDEGLAEIGQGMVRRGRDAESDRVQRLRWATRALLRGRRADDPLRFEHEHELWQDMARAALQAHDPVRRGGLVQGTATLVLRLMTGHLFAGVLATTALRGRISEQDATDALVLVTKMWRGTALELLLGSVAKDLAHVFFWSGDVLAVGAAPRPLPSWAE